MKFILLITVLLSSAAALSAPYYPMYIHQRTEQNQGKRSENYCRLSLASYDLNYSIEWRASATDPLWMDQSPNSGLRVIASNGTVCNSTTCYVHGDRDPKIYKETAKASQYMTNDGRIESFKPHVAYYFAARQFIDENRNGLWDRGEFVREWTPAGSISNSPDYIHRCTFNTAQ